MPVGTDLRRSLITVPSCEEHNLRKSGDDEYLMYVLTMDLPSGAAGQRHFSTKVTRAIQRRPSLIKRVLSTAARITLYDPITNEKYETLAMEAEGERLEQVLKKVALGLYRHHFKSSWKGALKVVPEFMRFLQAEKSAEWNSAIQEASCYADVLFASVPYCGDNPAVFQYQVRAVTSDVPATCRMHFYGQSRVLVVYGAADG